MNDLLNNYIDKKDNKNVKYCYYDLLYIKFILVSEDFGIVLFIV